MRILLLVVPLVITDYRMPQMSGIDFIEKIREKIPIVK